MLRADSSIQSLPENGHSPHHPPDGAYDTSKTSNFRIRSDVIHTPSGSAKQSDTGSRKDPASKRNLSPTTTATDHTIHTSPQPGSQKHLSQRSPINHSHNEDERADNNPSNAHAVQALPSAPSSALNHADSAVPPAEPINNRDGARLVSPMSRVAALHGEAPVQGIPRSLLQNKISQVPVAGVSRDQSQKRKSVETTTNSSGDEAAPNDSKRPNSHDELPLDVRNKKMKATDCLLFAATLLEDESADDQDLPESPSHGNYNVAHGPQITASSSFASDSGRENDNSTIGSTDNPRDFDVLCGRGGLINKHPGNVVYRKIVDHNKPFYQSVHKKHRILVSQSIVQSIVNFGGRFMTMGKGKVWTEIGYKRAVQKTSQALRERPSPDEDGGNDEGQHVIEETSAQEDERHYLSA
eukprot:scaffold2141_cov120-Cylindrotheca_fusiformis.AAC.11